MTCPLVSVKQSISQDRLGTNTGKKKVEGKGAFFAGPCVTDYTAWNSSACIPDETVQRAMRWAYYACISYTDALIGDVIGALTQLELADNTVIVSDNRFYVSTLYIISYI